MSFDPDNFNPEQYFDRIDVLLDKVATDLQQEMPTLTDDQATLATIRLNLLALVTNLIMEAETGRDLPNIALQNITFGLIQTVTWLTSREAAAEIVSGLENELK